MTDMNSLSWDRFQKAQHRLNLVKAHAHEIVGVKREQVHMVVENFSKPGTYDITVHENGKVYTAQWTPPAPGEAFPEVVEAMDEVEPFEYEVQEPAPAPSPAPTPAYFVTPPPPAEEVAPAPEPIHEEAPVEEEAHAPDSPAAAPRRRGRPKKHA